MNSSFGLRWVRTLNRTVTGTQQKGYYMAKRFNPRELQKDVAKLQSEGKMPSMQQFLGTLATVKKQSQESSNDQPKNVQQLDDALVDRVAKSHGISKEAATEELSDFGIL